MKERIEAVQKGFWRLLAAGIAVVLIGVPPRDDGATMEALKELRAFSSGFDRQSLESTLLAHAGARGAVPLSQVAEAIEGHGTPEVRAAASAPAIQPRARVNLQTLEQIHDLAGSAVQVQIGAVEPGSLARALGWRLAREPAEDGYTLTQVVLLDRVSSEADLQLEEDVVAARAELAEQRNRLKAAETEHEKAEALHEARRKWKAPWKSIVRANEARVEAKAKLDQMQSAWRAARDRYQELADKAASFEGTAGAAPERGVAQATLAAKGQSMKLTVPVRLAPREVEIPGLTGADFPVTHDRGLWQELSPLSVDAAISRLEGRFSWHNLHIEAGGVALGGMTLLQLAPLPLILLLMSVRRRSEGVGDSYNPFGAAAGEGLPRVGLGLTALNLLVLVVLPLAGSLLCAWSLLQIDRLPIIPLLCAAGAIVLGALCHLALKELSELRDAVTRSHSNPPPAPQAGRVDG